MLILPNFLQFSIQWRLAAMTDEALCPDQLMIGRGAIICLLFSSSVNRIEQP
jgi:hypothetical protein